MSENTSPKTTSKKFFLRGGVVLGIIFLLIFICFSNLSKLTYSVSSSTSSPTPIIPTATPTITATPISYKIQEGDTLISISQKFDLGPDGPLLIYFENREFLDKYDGLYFPGQPIKIPHPGSLIPTYTPVPVDLPSGTVVEHHILPGDQLNDLVTRYHSTLEDIIAANPEIADHPETLKPGQILQIPVNLVTATSTSLP